MQHVKVAVGHFVLKDVLMIAILAAKELVKADAAIRVKVV